LLADAVICGEEYSGDLKCRNMVIVAMYCKVKSYYRWYKGSDRQGDQGLFTVVQKQYCLINLGSF